MSQTAALNPGQLQLEIPVWGTHLWHIREVPSRQARHRHGSAHSVCILREEVERDYAPQRGAVDIGPGLQLQRVDEVHGGGGQGADGERGRVCVHRHALAAVVEDVNLTQRTQNCPSIPTPQSLTIICRSLNAQQLSTAATRDAASALRSGRGSDQAASKIDRRADHGTGQNGPLAQHWKQSLGAYRAVLGEVPQDLGGGAVQGLGEP